MVSAVSWFVHAAALLPQVSGHGFMTTPQCRGTKHGKFRYEPQSLGAVGPGGEITICGRGGAINFHEKDPVTKMPAPGSKFTFKAKITAHHYGHMIVRVCKFIDSGWSREDLKDNCIRLSSPSRTWDLSANTGLKSREYTLPSKSELLALGQSKHKGVYTIQWRWNTGNSCNPSEDPDNLNTNCNEYKCCSEVFTTCADVTFDGLDSAPPVPAKDPPAPPPPRPIGGGGGGGGGKGTKCARDPDCAANAWCNDATMIEWCRQYHSPGDCDSHVQCAWGGGGGGSDPEPEPEPEKGGKPPPPPKGVGSGKYILEPTPRAVSEELNGVQAFCDANKKYFCNVPKIGNDICDCSPDETDDDGPVIQPKPEPEPEPAGNGGGGYKVTKPSECAHFKDWCQGTSKFNVGCKGNVATNQCWGNPPYTMCKCSKGGGEITDQYPGPGGLLQTTEQDNHMTKFSDRVTRHIGAHGEIRP